MVGVPNSEILVLNNNGMFVDGQPATFYRGYEINRVDELVCKFGIYQICYPWVQAIHVLMSETPAMFKMLGAPSMNPGPYQWMRVQEWKTKPTDWYGVGPDNGQMPDFIYQMLNDECFQASITKACGIKSVDDKMLFLARTRAFRACNQQWRNIQH